MKGFGRVSAILPMFRSNAVFRHHVLEADLARDRRHWAGAVEHYQRAIQLKPAAVALRVQLGHALKELGRHAEAEMQYLKYLDETPTDPDIYLQLGHLYLVMGHAGSAKRMYKRSLELAQEGQVAIDAQLGSLSCGSDDVFARREHVYRLIASRKLRLAEEELARLIEEDGCVDLCLVYAGVCRDLGMLDTAATYCRRHLEFARKLSPKLIGNARTMLAELEVLSGNPASAIRTLISSQQQIGLKEDEIRMLQRALPEITTSLTYSF